MACGLWGSAHGSSGLTRPAKTHVRNTKTGRNITLRGKTHCGIICRPCARHARGVTGYVRVLTFRCVLRVGARPTFGRSDDRSAAGYVSFHVRHKASRVATPDINKPQQYGAPDPAACGPRESSTTPPPGAGCVAVPPRPPHVATPSARRPQRPINCSPPFLDRIVVLPVDAPVDAHPQTALLRNMSPNLALQLKPSPSRWSRAV